MNNLTPAQASIISNMQFIDTEVDYVPASFQEYKALPEPYRQEALARLITRRIMFSDMTEAKKKSFE